MVLGFVLLLNPVISLMILLIKRSSLSFFITKDDVRRQQTWDRFLIILLILFLLSRRPLTVRKEKVRDIVQSMIYLMGVVLFWLLVLLFLLPTVGSLRTLVVLLDFFYRFLRVLVGVKADHLRRYCYRVQVVLLVQRLPLCDGNDRCLELRLQCALALAPREHERFLPNIYRCLIFILFLQLPRNLLWLGPMSKVLPGSTETYVDRGIFKRFHEVVAE